MAAKKATRVVRSTTPHEVIAHETEIVDEPTELRLGVATIPIRAGEREGVPAFDESYLPSTREMESLEAVAIAITQREPALIVGPTGAGKSTLFSTIAACANHPLRRQNLHGDVRAADFIGERTIDVVDGASVVVWRDGVLPRAMREGAWLLLDEVDAAPAHILFVLQAVLERNGRLLLPGNGGEVVAPHEDFRIFATANTLGRGDEAGLYAGTNVLNEAFLDRFGVVVVVDYPEFDTEVEIVRRAGVPAELAKRMVHIATEIRAAAKREECFCTFSTRRLVAWARKAAITRRPLYAAEIAVLARLPTDDRAFVTGVVKRFVAAKERILDEDLAPTAPPPDMSDPDSPWDPEVPGDDDGDLE